MKLKTISTEENLKLSDKQQEALELLDQVTQAPIRLSASYFEDDKNHDFDIYDRQGIQWNKVLNQ